MSKNELLNELVNDFVKNSSPSEVGDLVNKFLEVATGTQKRIVIEYLHDNYYSMQDIFEANEIDIDSI